MDLPGFGIEGVVDGRRARMGRADWVGGIAEVPPGTASPAFAFQGGRALSFDLIETLRPGAGEAVAAFGAAGIPVAMLSGDIAARADRVARALGIADVLHGATPAEKIAVLETMRAGGQRPAGGGGRPGGQRPGGQGGQGGGKRPFRSRPSGARG